VHRPDAALQNAVSAAAICPSPTVKNTLPPDAPRGRPGRHAPPFQPLPAHRERCFPAVFSVPYGAHSCFDLSFSSSREGYTVTGFPARISAIIKARTSVTYLSTSSSVSRLRFGSFTWTADGLSS